MAAAGKRALEPGMLFAGRYEIVRLVARGAVGMVYEVSDRATGRRRALKVLAPSLLTSDDVRRRFALEATIAGRIESSHVVDVLDAGVAADGVPFMVMELLAGSDLAALLEKQGRFDIATTVSYLSQVALLLDQAHAAGIVHRDLKPANLFLVQAESGEPRIKVLDFGIAKLTEPSTAQDTGAMLGSPHYMAPEQIRFKHERVDARADVYALGQLAYCMLVGEPYWLPEDEAADSALQLFMDIAFGAKEPACRRASARRGVELPAGFDAWFSTSTAPAARDRYASASQAIRALAQACAVTMPGALQAVATGAPHHDDAAPAPSQAKPRARPWGALAALVALAAVLVLMGRESPGSRAAAGDFGRFQPSVAPAAAPDASAAVVPTTPAAPAAVPRPGWTRAPRHSASAFPSAASAAPSSSSAPSGWVPPVLER